MLSVEKEVHTRNCNYTLYFKPGSNSDWTIHLINHSTAKESFVEICADYQEFKYRAKSDFPSVIADLIDLAIAIHAADRLAFQNLRQEQGHIHVVLPVRNPEKMNSESFQLQLVNLLGCATGSLWIFEFSKRLDEETFVVQQPSLSVSSQDCEVALWSGGLDALAGVYQRLKSNEGKSFVLFGTGGNSRVYKLQKDTARQIQLDFPGCCTLYRVPIRFCDSNEDRKNKITRARGVVFAMLGAACSSLLGQQELCFYENGTGAINLPYRESSLGLDHTRSVHPLTLLKVSSLISELLGEPFRVWNPFLFSTKSEMCNILPEKLSSVTNSCDSPHRSNPSQYGYCSSCLLRRQALAAAKINDKTRYVVLHRNDKPRVDPSISLRHMLAQVDTLRYLLNQSSSSEKQWEILTSKYPILDDIVDRCFTMENLTSNDMQSKLIKLYQNYVTEWDDVKSQISIGLMEANRNES
jgi:hypothetical protein